MAFTVQQIAEALGATAFGATEFEVDAVAEPADAGPRDLALAMKPDYAEQIAQGGARVAMLWPGADWAAFGLEAAIIAPRPRFALSGLSAMMDPGQGWDTGIHPSAVIDPRAELAEGVSIGPLSVIGARARIGAGTVIGPQCFIGADSVIGQGGFLREGVRIGARVRIGDRFIAQPNAVIGSDGFSFVTPEQSGVERARATLGDQGEVKSQSYARIHSLGGVSIGDDVEIGSHTCIDRGTVRDTRIGNGTKIDNLVQIGHNVVIGCDTLLCGQVGIGGSAVIGNNVVMAGQTGIGDNLFVGDNVICGGATKALSNIPAGRVMLGYPAMKMDSQMEVYKGLRRLKRLFTDVAELKKTVSNLRQSD